ncbi:unnamed protein product, partial [Scytosiphon promiscuus]
YEAGNACVQAYQEGDGLKESTIMGVRREGTGKSRSTGHQAGSRTAAAISSDRAEAAAAAAAAGPDSEEESDPELQELYVQSYACEVFRDDSAASSVEEGVHLRPLTVPQDPEGEPLMLDRFDARWMLDLADFKKGAGSSVPAKLAAEEREADGLRYAGLPSGDHSVVVEGLGQFAPSGSYAHRGTLRGFGDEEEEEQPEVYGYYGRTASPPPGSGSNGQGAWAATPAPQYSVDSEGQAGASAGAGAVSDAGESSGGASKATAPGGVDGAEEFVPDFGVPQGLVAPSTVRQHMMMVGTARTAVRSPQLEVLLRLKQQSNAAFSFLSDEDPVHPYYVFLKSWGESALAAEYARQQRLQAERAETRLKEEQQRREREEREAAAAKAAEEAPPPPSSADPGQDSDDSDAPNLLGGAYESSEEEEDDDAQIPSAAAARPGGVPSTVAAPAGLKPPPQPPLAMEGSAVGQGGYVPASPASPSEPGEEKRKIVDKMVGYVAKNGQAFEERVRKREASNPTFDFLIPTNQFYPYYKRRLALAKGEAVPPAVDAKSPAPAAVAAGAAAGPSLSLDTQKDGPPAAAAGVIASGSDQPARVEDRNAAGAGVAGLGRRAGEEEEAASRAEAATATNESSTANDDTDGARASRLPVVIGRARRSSPPESLPQVGSQGDTDGEANASIGKESGSAAAVAAAEEAQGGIAESLRAKLGAKLGLALSRIDDREAHIEGSKRAQGENSGPGEAGDGTDGGKASPEGAVESSATPAAAAASVEDAETRRANRLKRARLMTGHYKLAVMEHSFEREDGAATADGARAADASNEPPPQAAPRAVTGDGGAAGSDGSSSAGDLSDLDDSSSSSSSDEDEDMRSGGGNDDRGSSDPEDGKRAVERPSPVAARGSPRTARKGGGRLSGAHSSGRGDESRSARKSELPSPDSRRSRGRRKEEHERGGSGDSRRDGGSHRKSKRKPSPSGEGSRREKSDRVADPNSSRRDGRRDARHGRSRSRSVSRGRAGGGGGGAGDRRKSGKDSDRGTRERSTRDADRASTRERERGERTQREDGGDRKRSSKASSRKVDGNGGDRGRGG